MNWKIPLFIPELTEADIQSAMQPLRDNWLTMGEKTLEFETAFRERIGAKHAFAVSSGTAALHIALASVGIQPGDEVLLPSLTFVACANVVKALGAEPVFVDLCYLDDWTISPDDIQHKITPKSKAVMAVHYAGFPCLMDEILAVAKKHQLAVMEDSAHAIVTKHNGIYCGCFGDVGCFSFFSNKNMTTGEGGMVVTNDDQTAEQIRLLRSHGMTTLTLDRHKGHAYSYDVTEFGYNYRLDEMRSALGLSQLNRLGEFLERRREVYQWYVDGLEGVQEIHLPFQHLEYPGVGHHIFPIRLKNHGIRGQLQDALKEQGIQTSIHYPAIHLFSAYSDYKNAECPITEQISESELTLPFYPSMTKEDVRMVCDGIKSFYSK